MGVLPNSVVPPSHSGPPAVSSSEQTRQNTLSQQIAQIGAPSSFAKSSTCEKCLNSLKNKGIPLLCHRPAQLCGADVSLFYPDFQTFVNDCESLSLDKDDTKFVTEFTLAMSEFYASEDKRNVEVQAILGKYLTGNIIHSVENTDGAVMYNGYPALIWELKNEVGSGGCDSYFEAIAYYLKLVNRSGGVLKKCPAPCFIVEIVGTHIAIYGAIYTDTVVVDRLTPCLWLAFQPNNRSAMAQLAKTLKALKNALQRLQTYYDPDLPSADAQAQFPCFREFDYEQQVTQITYTAEIKNHVFRAETNTGKRVIVKFVERYGTDAHKACAREGFAPQLLSVKQVTSQYKMVVMEDVENATTLWSYLRSNPNDKKRLLSRCKEALKALHEKGFCHGDFRSNNILVVPVNTNENDIQVIDFDWSGVANTDTCTYPLFMNHVNLQWHETASDGKVLKPEHDLYLWSQFTCE